MLKISENAHDKSKVKAKLKFKHLCSYYAVVTLVETSDGQE
jgi:hypothetical protein